VISELLDPPWRGYNVSSTAIWGGDPPWRGYNISFPTTWGGDPPWRGYSALTPQLWGSKWFLNLFMVLLVSLLFHFGEGHGSASSAGLTFELPDNEAFCFQEDFEGSHQYILEYRVIAGGNYDVDVTLESPSGKFLYKETRKEHDSFKFETSWGAYKLCFSNEFSTVTHKKVYFSLRPEQHDLLAAEGGKNVPSVNTFIESSMEKIHSSCTVVVHMQTQYRLNEAKGRNAADTLNLHVQWWSLSQAVVILLTGLGQVFSLRRFFTDKREKTVRPLPSASLISGPGGIGIGYSNVSLE